MEGDRAEYVRCVELDADDLTAKSPAQARTVIGRAVALGANALSAPSGTVSTTLAGEATSAGLRVIDAGLWGRRRSWLDGLGCTNVSRWPDLPPGAAAALLARRRRLWPNALTWVRASHPDGGAAAPSGPVPSNVIASVRATAGRPGRGFSAPWPEHPGDPAWAPVTVLPEPPPSRLEPGRGFAVNLWLCRDPGPAWGNAEVTATVRWGDHVHSWAFAGPVPTAGTVTIATLPLIRPVDQPLAMDLCLATEGGGGANPAVTWRYELTDDAAGVAFWSLSIPDE